MLVENPHKILPVFPSSCPSLPLINSLLWSYEASSPSASGRTFTAHAL
jgi:hypothetical protein